MCRAVFTVNLFIHHVIADTQNKQGVHKKIIADSDIIMVWVMVWVIYWGVYRMGRICWAKSQSAGVPKTKPQTFVTIKPFTYVMTSP